MVPILDWEGISNQVLQLKSAHVIGFVEAGLEFSSSSRWIFYVVL